MLSPDSGPAPLKEYRNRGGRNRQTAHAGAKLNGVLRRTFSIDFQSVVERRVSPLPAVEALTDTAGHTNRRRRSFVSEVEPVRVDELSGIPDVAPKADGILGRLFPSS